MKPVVVIGAGPYGLSTAAHLTRLGVAVRVVGTPMSGWSGAMPAGTILRSPPADCDIAAPGPGHTLQDFNDAMGERRLLGPCDLVTLDTFVRYGQWYADRLVPGARPGRVTAVGPAPHGAFRVALEDGEELTAPAVVVATGLTGSAHLPYELRGLAPAGPAPGASVSHSSQHTAFAAYAGRRVAVVGAGQSALECAALLTDAGAAVTLLARRRGAAGFAPAPAPAPAVPRRRPPAVPPALRHVLPAAARRALDRPPRGPRGAWWLRERFTGAVTVLDGHRVTAAGYTGPGYGAAGAGEAREGGIGVDTRVLLLTAGPDGCPGELVADHVLAATGYRFDLGAVTFLAPALHARLARDGGTPRLDRGLCSRVPGLYFTGPPAAAAFGPALRSVYGTWFAAPRVARAVAARLRDR